MDENESQKLIEEHLNKQSHYTELVTSSKELTYIGNMPFRLRRFLLNLLYFISINILPILLIYFVNKQIPNGKDLIFSIGASNTISNLTLTPLILGLSSVIEILGCQSFSSKKYHLFGCYLNRVRIIGYCLIFCISILMFISKQHFL